MRPSGAQATTAKWASSATDARKSSSRRSSTSSWTSSTRRRKTNDATRNIFYIPCRERVRASSPARSFDYDTRQAERGKSSQPSMTAVEVQVLNHPKSCILCVSLQSLGIQAGQETDVNLWRLPSARLHFACLSAVCCLLVSGGKGEGEADEPPSPYFTYFFPFWIYTCPLRGAAMRWPAAL